MRKLRRLLATTLAVVMTLTSLTMMNSVDTQAKGTKSIVVPGCAVKEGKYIYYAYEGDGMRMGITRYNTETGKTKLIFHDEKNVGYGYHKLTVKGSYIYFVWSKTEHGASDCNYVYRVGTNGKNLKKLALAGDYVIKGKKIYFLEEKIQHEDGETYGLKTGNICSMSLTGTGKKVVKTIRTNEIYNYSLALYDGKVVYSNVRDDVTYKGYHTLDGKRVKISESASYQGTRSTQLVSAKSSTDGATYEVKMGIRNILYRKEAGKAAQKVIKFNRDVAICDYTVCGNVVMIRAFDMKYNRGYIYAVSLNGTKKQLKAWLMAE